MILLDTNVVSEAMKAQPDEAVRDWLNDQASETLVLCSVTLAELEFGIETLPAGRRKNALKVALEGWMSLFDARVLPFDAEAAHHYAKLAAGARTAGRRVSLADGYIAAIASAHALTVATRDAAPFLATGLRVIDPWKA